MQLRRRARSNYRFKKDNCDHRVQENNFDRPLEPNNCKRCNTELSQFQATPTDRVRPDPLAWARSLDHRADLGALWNPGRHEVQLSCVPGRSRMGDLGKTPLQPYAGHLFRLAGKCIHRVLLLRCASVDELSSHQPQARLGPVLAVNFAVVLPASIFLLSAFSQPPNWPTFPLSP